MNGHELITKERDRQKSIEGWTAAHDDRHDRGQLEDAAECYWQSAVKPGFVVRVLEGSGTPKWPWDWTWFKPFDENHRGYFPRVDSLRCLVKAGALILAERDRYGRLGDLIHVTRLNNRASHVASAIDAMVAEEEIERCDHCDSGNAELYCQSCGHLRKIANT